MSDKEEYNQERSCAIREQEKQKRKGGNKESLRTKVTVFTSLPPIKIKDLDLYQG